MLVRNGLLWFTALWNPPYMIYDISVTRVQARMFVRLEMSFAYGSNFWVPIR